MKKFLHGSSQVTIFAKSLTVRQFVIIVISDEAWVHYFEPRRKTGNVTWLTKHCKRPVVAIRTISTKHVLLKTKQTDQKSCKLCRSILR